MVEVTYFPQILNELERLHFKSRVQSAFNKESNQDPRIGVSLLELLSMEDRRRFPKEKESQLIATKDPSLLLKYRELTSFKEKWPEAEPVLASTLNSAIIYAEETGPFPAGEPVMAKSPKVAFWYATDVLKNRFPLAEPVLKENPGYWEAYQEELGFQSAPVQESVKPNKVKKGNRQQ